MFQMRGRIKQHSFLRTDAQNLALALASCVPWPSPSISHYNHFPIYEVWITQYLLWLCSTNSNL